MSSYNRFSYINKLTDGHGDDVLDFKSAEWKAHVRLLSIVKNRPVLQEEQNNLPLICFKEYGTVDVWWVVALANNLFSPMADLPVGTLLRIPSITSINQMLSRAVPKPVQDTKSPGTTTVRRNIL